MATIGNNIDTVSAVDVPFTGDARISSTNVQAAITEVSSEVGAIGGGGDRIFYENGTTVTADYTTTVGKNAMSAGPITINDGVTVTVSTGGTWVIV